METNKIYGVYIFFINVSKITKSGNLQMKVFT